MTSLSQNDLTADHYRITVTSTANPTYAELKQAYIFVSEVWDESKYRIYLHESLREIVPSAGDRIVFLKEFDHHCTSDQAIAWAHENGYRLAMPFEREAFAKANSDLQQIFSIVDLGTYISGEFGRRDIPTLNQRFGGRRLDSDWLELKWHAGRRFLFVRV